MGFWEDGQEKLAKYLQDLTNTDQKAFVDGLAFAIDVLTDVKAQVVAKRPIAEVVVTFVDAVEDGLAERVQTSRHRDDDPPHEEPVAPPEPEEAVREPEYPPEETDLDRWVVKAKIKTPQVPEEIWRELGAHVLNDGFKARRNKDSKKLHAYDCWKMNQYAKKIERLTAEGREDEIDNKLRANELLFRVVEDKWDDWDFTKDPMFVKGKMQAKPSICCFGNNEWSKEHSADLYKAMMK